MTRDAAGMREVYVRLAQLALELDDVATELAAIDVTYGQAEAMSVPAAHLEHGVDRLTDALHRAQLLDQSHRAHELAPESRPVAQRDETPSAA